MQDIPIEDDGMKDNITDWALDQYRTAYGDHTITKEDIFFYTYGMLNHRGYRSKYSTHLIRGIPNIPFAPDFRAFERAGRELAQIHLNYKTCERYDLGQPLHPIPNAPRRIAYGKKPNKGDGPKDIPDHTILKLNGQIIYNNLPATQYKVGGSTPIGWFVKRYGYDIDKRFKSHNTNYPLEGYTGEEVRAIIERLVYVGVESDRIISGLPEKFERDDVEMDPASAKSSKTETHQLVFGREGLEPNPASLDRYTKAAV